MVFNFPTTRDRGVRLEKVQCICGEMLGSVIVDWDASDVEKQKEAYGQMKQVLAAHVKLKHRNAYRGEEAISEFVEKLSDKENKYR